MVKKLSILLAWCVGLWLFFGHFTPWIVAQCPAWQHFDNVQEETGIMSGAVYYSDVPVTQESEAHVREAVREGMKARAAARNNH